MSFSVGEHLRPRSTHPQDELMSVLLISLTTLCVTGIAIGQLLFKKAAGAMSGTVGWQSLLLNGWLWAALALYGVMTLLWIWILRHAPLHIAYPFMGLAFLIVPVLAWLWLGEPLSWQTLAGGVLILAGVTLASSAGHG